MMTKRVKSPAMLATLSELGSFSPSLADPFFLSPVNISVEFMTGKICSGGRQKPPRGGYGELDDGDETE
jgi:hypothetical protein